LFGLMAAAATTNSAEVFSGSVGGWVPILKMFSALLIVLGLMVFLTYLAKRYYPGMRGAGNSRPDIRVVGTVYLGSKRSIAVIGVQGKRLVVGMTPSSITLLTTLEEDEEKTSVSPEVGKGKGKSPLPFSKIFKHQLMRKTTGEAL